MQTPKTPINPTVQAVTEQIRTRSQARRAAYLATVEMQRANRLARKRLSAANLAHGFSALPKGDKLRVVSEPVPMIGIVSSYNDVLSAHQPMADYPAIIKDEIRKHAAVAQFAGGVPAMCDGVRQNQPGMELSLFSRDVIAMSTAIALTHDLYDGAMMLGVCDKIVPSPLMGALAFGHLLTIFCAGRADFERSVEQGKNKHSQTTREGESGARQTARSRNGDASHRRHLFALWHRE